MNLSPKSIQTKPRLGKRGKGKYTADKSLKDAYQFYVNRFKEHTPLTKFSDSSQRSNPLPWPVFKKNAHLILEQIMEKVVVKSETFTVPYNLGIIRVRKRKMNIGLLSETNNLKIDWGYFQKTGKVLKHLNENRDNCRYGFYWLCKKGPKGKNFYKFQALRQHRRALAYLLNNTNIDYFE